MAFPYRYLSKGIYRGIRVDQVTLRGLLFACFCCFPQGHFAGLGWLFILEFLPTNRTVPPCSPLFCTYKGPDDLSFSWVGCALCFCPWLSNSQLPFHCGTSGYSSGPCPLVRGWFFTCCKSVKIYTVRVCMGKHAWQNHGVRADSTVMCVGYQSCCLVRTGTRPVVCE